MDSRPFYHVACAPSKIPVGKQRARRSAASNTACPESSLAGRTRCSSAESNGRRRNSGYHSSMTRAELEDAIRAACEVSGDDEVYVFGSQRFLGSILTHLNRCD